MTYEELLKEVKTHYGDAGVYAAEASCLTSDDLAKGLEHCLLRIAPALEEEMGIDDAIWG